MGFGGLFWEVVRISRRETEGKGIVKANWIGSEVLTSTFDFQSAPFSGPVGRGKRLGPS